MRSIPYMLALAALPVSLAAQTALDGSVPAPDKLLDVQGLVSGLTNSVLPRADLRLPAAPANSPEEIERNLLKKQAKQRAREKDYQRAVELFSRVLKADPGDASARFGLGTVLIQSGQYAAAIKLYQDMIAQAPEDYFIKNNLAWLYATAKDIRFRNGRKARQLAQDALLINPADYHVWSTLSEAYYLSGGYEKGMRAAGQALGLARAKNAGMALLIEYDQQYQKCRQAARTLTILD